MRHINLLDPPKREVSPYSPLLQMAVPVLLVALVSIGWASYAHHQLGVAKLRLNEIEAHIRPVREEESQLQAGMGAEQRNTALHDRIDLAQTQLAARLGVQGALQRGELGSTHGFSQFMQSFARQTISGVWLTALVLDNSGRNVLISGRALDPEAVARLVGKLRAEPALAGRSIAMLSLAPHEDKPDETTSAPRSTARIYDFTLASNGPGEVMPGVQSAPEAAPAPTSMSETASKLLDKLTH